MASLTPEQVSKIARKSSHKGASFERMVGKTLSLWLSGGERRDLFRRSVMSGGSKFVAQSGDIAAADAAGHVLTDQFVIECKHYAEPVLGALLRDSPRCKLRQWWAKVNEEANSRDIEPMLIVKQHALPMVACLRSSGVARYLSDSPPLAKIYAPARDMYCFLVDDLLNDPSFLQKVRTHHVRTVAG
jgi:hypothetical protein